MRQEKVEADAPKRKRLPSEERREAFIEKAIEFFAEEGFESSTRELARRLGVTQPLLYRYFPSKEDLINEVYEVVYVNRWRDAWSGLLTDRSRPMSDRLLRFYDEYTDKIFQPDWLRIFLFSGLKGVDINKRYLALVRHRILEPIVREAQVEAGFPERDPTDEEVELAWVMHGGIIYYGVRALVYQTSTLDDRQMVLRESIRAFLPAIIAHRKSAGG